MPTNIRIGTRGSALARWQADWVAARLAERDVKFELVHITTLGDQQQRGPIAAMGGQGVFTKEIQRALLENEIDVAVHSLKDLPTEPVEGLALAAVPLRGPTSDVLVGREGKTFDELSPGATIGTGSIRRQAQLWHARADLNMEDIRGNVDTRLKKLDAGEFDAIILAEAGLRRLGLADRMTQVLPDTLMLPAVGQGALGIETRAEDETTRAALEPLDDPPTHAAVLAERTLLAELRGGCLAPVGALGHVEHGQLRLEAVVLSPDGKERIAAAESRGGEEAEALGRAVAQDLLDQGAAELIHASRAV